MAYEPMNRIDCASTTRTALAIRAGVTAAALLLLASCRQDMQNQPKFIPLRENDFMPIAVRRGR